MNTFRIRVTLLGAVMLLFGLPCRGDSTAPGRWTKERANDWYAKQPWLVGCNFIPSTACNQLEMWQAATFDAATIDRELGFAERLGFNSVRVFLHDLLWLHDKEGLMRRVDQFLDLAQKHKIGVMLVLFDSCWNPLPKAGPQPEPRPRTHNAGWAQSPSIEVLKNPAAHPHLRDYVTGIISRFKDDRRVQVWDVWNEPGNFDGGSAKRPGLEPKNKAELVRPLLEQVFACAREANPSQPLTSAPWAGPNDDAPPNPIEAVQLSQSDVTSFHFYGRMPGMERRLTPLRKLGRPILCTECVGRIGGGQFDPIYGFLKKQRVGAYCWGFVAGRTQTIYPGDSWVKSYTAEPPVWCCDLLRADGTPFRQEEMDYIRRVAGRE